MWCVYHEKGIHSWPESYLLTTLYAIHGFLNNTTFNIIEV